MGIDHVAAAAIGASSYTLYLWLHDAIKSVLQPQVEVTGLYRHIRSDDIDHKEFPLGLSRMNCLVVIPDPMLPPQKQTFVMSRCFVLKQKTKIGYNIHFFCTEFRGALIHEIVR